MTNRIIDRCAPLDAVPDSSDVQVIVSLEWTGRVTIWLMSCCLEHERILVGHRSSFDTGTATTHPTGVRSLSKRVATIVCVLTLAQTAVGLCAGWQATPEARLECCQDGACPLHHHDEAPGTPVTQSAADDCCALSSSPESRPSAAAFAPTITLAVLRSVPPSVVTLAPALLPVSSDAPSPPAHVPKHLLLSVFLV
jgi:hypothetical protein